MPALQALTAGPDILLDRGVVIIGRHPDGDVQLDSHCVSRRHCIISLDKGRIVVRDLGSTNGT
jgi:pSer/pThr/pTyr-binding forkhead associated (FHA) protein